jgi:signal transduction histidine kinase
MGLIPDAIQAGLVAGTTKLAWVTLQDSVVVDVGGATDYHALSDVAAGQPLPDTAAWASAISDQPLTGEPVELKGLSLNPEGDYGSDVIAWQVEGVISVLFFDASSTVKLLGATMQRANTDAFLRDRLAGAERMRRVERRSRGEAFSALGYELLEEGPDGVFRPPTEPAPWLVTLCGWEPGEARVVDPGDPVDYLSSFLGDAAEFFRGVREGSADQEERAFSSGIWTEILPESRGLDAEYRDQSFQAHALALTDGRGVVVVELKSMSLEEMQSTLQRQRDAELSYEGLSHEMQVKDVLLHCIVHDLRGPLASLVGAFSLLESGRLDAVDQKETIEMGLRQAKRQDEMIRHVLDVFSAEYEALRQYDDDPATAPDAVTIARETTQRQKAAYQAAGVELVVTGDAGPLPVVGTADRLERVIANLIGNALRHAPKGSAVEVDLKSKPGGHVVVSVLDRGPGVPEAIRERLFRRFVQGGSAGAAGLGLFYVRMTVERWGGTAEYAPREGGGAAFQVKLRRATLST